MVMITLPPKVIKTCDVNEIMLNFCHYVLIKGLKPLQWSILNIVPVTKKVRLDDFNNNPGVTLIHIAVKLLNNIILHRIKGVIYVASETQAKLV